MEFPSMTTDRLDLVQIEMKHAEALFTNFSNPEVVKYYGMEVMTDLSQAERLVSQFEDMQQGKRGLRWGIVVRKENRFVGTIGLNQLSKGMRRAEIGFEIHPDFWQTGITSEALQAVLRYAFEELNLHRMGAVTFLDNVASIGLLKKHGFQQEGILRGYLFQNGQSHDARVFSLLDSEFRLTKERAD
ncbi:GNAT family N-acetyltransferase [Sporosarcina cyprini]|uniref:GNAT family N-acetyltransferase n=1 Tax=Sporosarcina cyprini TaxID=2910523 RepID=UPI001EE05568|nr:GNAT family protein [Sporosarcina cyprini]MCG3089695.1 GNAT family N-acetyltransferase [Sporosarcina cyprini]